MEQLQNRLKQFKTERKLSTAEISRQMGIHAPTWCKYESGKSKMSIETLQKFCRTFNVSADWLLGLPNVQPAQKEDIQDNGSSVGSCPDEG